MMDDAIIHLLVFVFAIGVLVGVYAPRPGDLS